MRVKLLAIILLAFIFGAGLAVLLNPGGVRQWLVGQTSGTALIGGPFSLTDHTGKRVTDKDFRGRLMLVYFGFTYCPDVCPAGLQTIAAALELLGPKARGLTPVFVTVDPERDTPAVLADYLANFNSSIRGLTGSTAEVADMLRAYRVYARKVEDKGSLGAYTFDHSSLIYLMDAEGRYLTHFRYSEPPEALASGLAAHL